DILIAHLDLLHGTADAVRRGGTGGRDRVVDALDLEWRGQAGGNGAAHGASDTIRSDSAQALLAHHVGGLDLISTGSTARTGDQAGTVAGYLFRRKPGVFNGLGHADIGIGSSVAHEAAQLAVDQGIEVD